MNQKGLQLAIQVMIVLFVSIAVALLILNFSSQIISTGEQQIREFSLECTENADFFVETSSITDSSMARLVDICHRNNFGSYNGDKICYIVHGASAPAISQQGIESLLEVEDAEISLFDLSGAGKTVYVKFSQLTQSIEITG